MTAFPGLAVSIRDQILKNRRKQMDKNNCKLKIGLLYQCIIIGNAIAISRIWQLKMVHRRTEEGEEEEEEEEDCILKALNTVEKRTKRREVRLTKEKKETQ